ncbi:hypothetical protein PtA15_11A3 [Puccinia triticina]|uniref:Uncharacterized protein n=1 Tax=Puccinia triticina TaxID=208348 RepID=A0ABY7CVK0_9BASI|nr:uncharacterized protein PtA15_11A3 [Puccinia triticina]WAQ89316.1 hypothetical protein PtA15_11A3 [Puccinia triticina]
MTSAFAVSQPHRLAAGLVLTACLLLSSARHFAVGWRYAHPLPPANCLLPASLAAGPQPDQRPLPPPKVSPKPSSARIASPARIHRAATYSSGDSRACSAKMASRNTTDSQTPNSNTTSLRRDDDKGKSDSEQNKTGAATYYGAVVIAVFVLIALSIVIRILYTRRARRRNPPIDEPDAAAREDEERMAMERRGEEMGLPTYRESTQLPNNDTVLAATPITSTPFVRESTAETLPHLDDIPEGHTSSLPIDDNAQPPKYEDDPAVGPIPHQASDLPTLDITNEMRMSTQSTATLVLPSIAIHEPDDENLARNQSNPQIAIILKI